MSDGSQVAAMRDAGWRFDLDDEGGELHMEHVDSGKTYVFDDQGDLTVPGEADVGGDLHELQDALSTALAAECGDDDSQDHGSCSIECDESTGEVTIESAERISLDAPVIDLSASSEVDVSSRQEVTVDGGTTVEVSGNELDLSSDANTSLTSNGVVTIQGALVKVN